MGALARTKAASEPTAAFMRGRRASKAAQPDYSALVSASSVNGIRVTPR